MEDVDAIPRACAAQVSRDLKIQHVTTPLGTIVYAKDTDLLDFSLFHSASIALSFAETLRTVVDDLV